jgi:hypothetical protein
VQLVGESPSSSSFWDNSTILSKSDLSFEEVDNMLRSKFLSACAATALAIGLPLSVSPQIFAPKANDTEVNGVVLNGVVLNGTHSTATALASSATQSLRVEGGQLVVQAEIAR